MRLIDADALRVDYFFPTSTSSTPNFYYVSKANIDNAPTIDAVPIQFIHEVIEYWAKCRDNAIHEETKCAWDEQRQTLIMLLHEWDEAMAEMEVQE